MAQSLFDDDGNLDVIFDRGCRKNSLFRLGVTVTMYAIPQGRCVRFSFFESFKTLSSRIRRVFSLEASTAAAWWLKARARLNRTSSGSTTINSFVTCRCGSAEYLGSPQSNSESSLVTNQAALVELLPCPTRKLPYSYGVNMEIITHGRHKKC